MEKIITEIHIEQEKNTNALKQTIEQKKTKINELNEKCKSYSASLVCARAEAELDKEKYANKDNECKRLAEEDMKSKSKIQLLEKRLEESKEKHSGELKDLRETIASLSGEVDLLKNQEKRLHEEHQQQVRLD
jgi:predicted  nucleic acid-binding Zn-ribbon protein